MARFAQLILAIVSRVPETVVAIDETTQGRSPAETNPIHTHQCTPTTRNEHKRTIPAHQSCMSNGTRSSTQNGRDKRIDQFKLFKIVAAGFK